MMKLIVVILWCKKQSIPIRSIKIGLICVYEIRGRSVEHRKTIHIRIIRRFITNLRDETRIRVHHLHAIMINDIGAAMATRADLLSRSHR